MRVKRIHFSIETRLTPQFNPQERSSVVEPNKMLDLEALIKIELFSPTAILTFVEPKPEPVTDKSKMPPPNTFNRLEKMYDIICRHCGQKFENKFERYSSDFMEESDQRIVFKLVRKFIRFVQIRKKLLESLRPSRRIN